MQHNTEMVPYCRSRGKNLNLSLGLDWTDHPFHCGQTQNYVVMVLPMLWLCLLQLWKAVYPLEIPGRWSGSLQWASDSTTRAHRASSICALTSWSEKAAVFDVNPVLTKKNKYIPGQTSGILFSLLSLLGYKEALHLLLEVEFNHITPAPLLSLSLLVKIIYFLTSTLYTSCICARKRNQETPLKCSEWRGWRDVWCCPYSYSEGGPRVYISFICPIPQCQCLTILWHPSAFGKGMICESNVSMDNK